MGDAQLEDDCYREEIEDESNRQEQSKQLLVFSEHHEKDDDGDDGLKDYGLVGRVVFRMHCSKLGDEELVSRKGKKQAWHGDYPSCG